MPYALVTGASRGIGKCIAETLAAKGFNLILTARSQDALKAVQQELIQKYTSSIVYFAIDFTEEGSAQKLFDFCKAHQYDVQILVNNAGYGLSGSFEKYTAKEHTDMMHVNMDVPVTLCSLFLPDLKRQPKAYILNVASSAAYQAVPGLTVYAASKVFVLSFSRGLRKELKKTKVSVTCICPGSTDTDFVNRAQANDKARKLAEKVNMTPEEVAKIAVSGMLKGKAEIIPGAINKIGAFLTWLLPKNVLENGAMKIYEP